MSQIGVVIVTHNSEAVIEACLRGCVGLDTVVVDNASGDETCRRVREYGETLLLANRTNRGFAAAVNQGVSALSHPYILLLNPDAFLLGGAGRMAAECDGICGGKLVDARGNVQAGFTVRRFPTPLTLAFEVLGFNRVFPSNPVNRRYRCLNLNLDAPCAVEQPAGAFLMFRRTVWESLGGFDEAFYPLWFEDVDFCRRAAAAGFPIRYVPDAVARHTGAHSIVKLKRECRELCWYASLLRYASKHCSRPSYRLLSGAVVLGCAFRALLGAVRTRSWAVLGIYSRIMRMAGRSALAGRMRERDIPSGVWKAAG